MNYEHVILGKQMAKVLREVYGAAALDKIPACRERATPGLQAETVRMAEKFLTMWAFDEKLKSERAAAP
jgi:hypothetical protein